MEIVATERIKVGSIETKSHDVRGDVFILDENTLEIDYFHYDGKYQKIKNPNRVKAFFEFFDLMRYFFDNISRNLWGHKELIRRDLVNFLIGDFS